MNALKQTYSAPTLGSFVRHNAWLEYHFEFMAWVSIFNVYGNKADCRTVCGLLRVEVERNLPPPD